MAKVLLTGATSFTGSHIAAALGRAGFEVVATLTRTREDYSEALTRKRMEWAAPAEWCESTRFGDDSLLEAITRVKPEVFINHGAEIKGYRSPDFDYVRSVTDSLRGGEAVVRTLKENGARRFIHSGSIFEPDEGVMEFASESGGSPAVSLYGVSKRMVWEPLRYFCHKHGLAASKIVIPNPIGPLENTDRLIPYFFSQWKAGLTPVLKTPDLVRDHLPADWLARVYAEEARATGDLRIRRPSGFVLSTRQLVAAVAKHCPSTLNCAIKVEPVASAEPPERVNFEACPETRDSRAQETFWNAYVDSLL